MASAIIGGLANGGLTGLAAVINSIRGKSPEDAAKLEQMRTDIELMQMKYASDFELAQVDLIKSQIEVNKQEASNGVFIGGWRPFIGWVCGFGLASDIIGRPFATWVCHLKHIPVDYPQLDMSTLLPVMLGMLGLAAARTVDKINGNGDTH